MLSHIRRFSGYFLAAAACLLTPVAVVNISVDVEGVFAGRTDDERMAAYADALHGSPRGLIIPAKEGVGARLLKVELARKAQADCYVFGASVVEMLDRQAAAKLAECRQLVNLWTPGALYEDFVILADLVVQKPETKLIIVDASIWSFRRWKKNGLNRHYFSLFDPARRRLGLPESSDDELVLAVGAVQNIFNGRYFLRNVNVLKKKGIAAFGGPNYRNPVYVPEDDSFIDQSAEIMLPDGTYRYPRSYVEAEMGKDLNVLYIKRTGSYYWKILVPDLNKTIDVAKKYLDVGRILSNKGIRVVMLQLPTHPAIWEFEDEEAKNGFSLLTKTLSDGLNGVNGILAGSYNPYELGIDESDYIDERHLKKIGIDKVMQIPNRN